MRAWIYGLLLMLLVQLAAGATIQGNVYDFSLSPVRAVVEINTTPTQKIVAKESYSFEVSPGTYVLRARQLRGNSTIASIEEEVTISSEGNFNLDLILFPSLDVNESLNVDNPNVDPDEFDYLKPVDKWLTFLALLSVLLIILGLHYSHRKHMESHAAKEWKEDMELDEDAQEMLDFIDRKKRVTQKEIRSEFNHSSSKISLILTELEDKGLIKKIKRGRGNVIIRN